MNSNAELVMGIAVLMLGSLAVFAVYNWRHLRRRRLVDTWVREYLKDRFGEMPSDLRINCSNDRLWPILVDFEVPRTETQYHLQFVCPGTHSSLSLRSEKKESQVTCL